MNTKDSFSSLFAPEAVKLPSKTITDPWKVLLVDDEPDIHAVLRLALQDVLIENRSLYLLDAKSAKEAKSRLAEHPDIALILLDVVMETEQAGLELVHYVRHGLGSRAIQIVLVTGQPGYAPEREVVVDYEINGYRLKSELSADKIFVSVHTALRTYSVIQELELHRRQLEEQAGLLLDQQKTLSHWGQVFEHAEWGIVIGSADGKMLELANPAFARLHGYSVEEVLAVPIPELFIPEERTILKKHIAKSHELGHYTFESRHLRKDGSVFPVLVDVTAVKDDQGKVLYRVVNVQDITKQKETEAKNIALNEELEKRVSLRTLELENKNVELEKINKMFVGRELRMAELKKKMRELEKQLENQET